MSNAFAVEEATVAGDRELYWNLHDLERERPEEERQFHELELQFGLLALAYYTFLPVHGPPISLIKLSFTFSAILILFKS
jgi:hypothetical protein